MGAVLKPCVVAITGTSLATGRLSADWVPTLNREARTYPECKGPVFILNMGHGSWTSNDILANIPNIVALKPTHVWLETGSINDCPDFGSGPAVSFSTHNANVTAMVSQLRAGIPGVDITIVTMSSVAIYQTARANLALYYAADVSLAGSLGTGLVDNYSGTTTVPGGWPKPLDGRLTNGAFPAPYAAPSGFLDVGAMPALDPAAKAPAVTIVDGAGQTGQSTGGNHNAVRQMAGFSSGNYYAAFLPTPTASNGTLIGLVSPSFTFVNGIYVGFLPHSIGYDQTGDVSLAGGSVATYATWGLGDVIGVAFQPAAGKVWFAKNNVWQSGNPNTLTGGVSIPADTYYPAFSVSFTDEVACLPLFGDGLHPIWAGAVNTYLYPNVVAWLRAKFASFWP
jgi:hypothetical protein